MAKDLSEINEEQLMRIARIVEDVVKIHELNDELNRLSTIPSSIRVRLGMMLETMELLNLLRTAYITKHPPKDYESDFTMIKRGTAYVKIDKEWKKVGQIGKEIHTTIENLIKLRGEIVIITTSIIDEEISNGNFSNIKELAIFLRNLSERMLLNEQEQIDGLDGMFQAVKTHIEEKYEQNKEFFDEATVKELKKANENYVYFQINKKNRVFERMIEEGAFTLSTICEFIPPYFIDSHGVLARFIENYKPLLDESESDSSSLEEIIGRFSFTDDGLVMSSSTGDKKESSEEEGRKKGNHTEYKNEIIRQLNKNRARLEPMLYGLLEKIEEEKIRRQIEFITQKRKETILEELEGVVEDIMEMKRLEKQLKRMRLTDETKMRFVLFTQTTQLVHLIKSGIMNHSHKMDAWEIDDGEVYLKNPILNVFGLEESKVLLGKVEERDTITQRLFTYRKEALKTCREKIKEEIKDWSALEVAELLENLSRRLSFNYQDQSTEIIKTVEIVWEELKEKYKKEKMESQKEEESAKKADEIANKIITSVKCIESMRTDDVEAKKIGSKIKDEMTLAYLEVKEENIIRFRVESEEYLEEVQTAYEAIPALLDSIKKHECEILFTENQGNFLLEIVEKIDYDKVLLKGARERAFPLIEIMEEIIRMLKEENGYNEKERERMKLLFEACAVLISKFVVRFQIPYVLNNGEKEPEVRALDYEESIGLIKGILDFLNVLTEYKDICTPYYGYEIEAERAIIRISEEALCPAIDSMEKAYKAVDIIVRNVNRNEEMKKYVAEIIGHIANKVMVIELELEKKGKSLNKEDQLKMISILYIASAYSGANLYKKYADERYEDPILRIIDSIKNKKEDIDIGLQLLEIMLNDKLKEQIHIPELKEIYLGKILIKLNELKEAVQNKWDEKCKNMLQIIILTVIKEINEINNPEKKVVDSGGKRMNSIPGSEEIGIGRFGRGWERKI